MHAMRLLRRRKKNLLHSGKDGTFPWGDPCSHRGVRLLIVRFPPLSVITPVLPDTGRDFPKPRGKRDFLFSFSVLSPPAFSWGHACMSERVVDPLCTGSEARETRERAALRRSLEPTRGEHGERTENLGPLDGARDSRARETTHARSPRQARWSQHPTHARNTHTTRLHLKSHDEQTSGGAAQEAHADTGQGGEEA